MDSKLAPLHITEGNYYSLSQVAELHQVYPQTALYWVKRGWLPAVRLPGLGYIVAEQDALAFRVRRRKRTNAAKIEGCGVSG